MEEEDKELKAGLPSPIERSDRASASTPPLQQQQSNELEDSTQQILSKSGILFGNMTPRPPEKGESQDKENDPFIKFLSGKVDEGVVSRVKLNWIVSGK